jgi:ferrous iron transport protein B
LAVALAGNPNAGKTTMFNALTGARQHVGNWPGVTVEKKSGLVEWEGRSIEVVDLPGAYSLTAYTDEERVARNFLINERPGVVLNVLNAGALERNLYLTVQFLELGVPVVLLLNMMDEVAKQGKTIDTAKLAELMDCPAVEAVARRGVGRDEALRRTVELAGKRQGEWKPLLLSYGPDLDPALWEMEKLIEDAGLLTDKVPARWTALKYLEGDPVVRTQGRERDARTAARLEDIVAKCETHLQQTLEASPEAIIADYRYGYIAGVLRHVVTRQDQGLRLDASDRLDRLLTHRLAGPLIMAGVVYVIYVITFALGRYPMDGLGWLFERLGDGASALLPEGLLRSLVVSGMIKGVGGVVGFVPLIMLMFLLLSALEDSGYMARMAYMLDRVFKIFGLHGSSVLPFVVSGGIAGGCAVPGVMSARTLRSPKERLATILTAPFMTCGAKVPVFLMLAQAFFPRTAPLVMFLVTLGGWCVALAVARVLRWTVVRGEPTPFVMELPPYRLPTAKGLAIHTWERCWEYLRKAGTTILAVSVLLWAAMTFPGLSGERAAFHGDRIAALEAQIAEAREAGTETGQLAILDGMLRESRDQQAQEAMRATLAGRLGTALEPLTRPAGFDWRIDIALIGGVAAKEVIVSTLATAFALGEADREDSTALSEKLAQDPGMSPAGALALMVFVLVYAPCFVTLVTISREAGRGWAAFSLGFNTALAYGLAVCMYQLASRIL